MDALDPQAVDRLGEPRRVVPVTVAGAVVPDVALAPVDHANAVRHGHAGEPGVGAVLLGDEARDRRGVVELGLDDVVPERDDVVALGERRAELPAGAVVRRRRAAPRR